MAALGTRSLTLTIGGTDYTAQISNCRLVGADADSDFVSFADAGAGGARKYTLSGTMVQDPAANSLWDKIWTALGTTVAAVLKPNGGTTPSATQPSFAGNVVITEPDGDLLGGAANKSPSARFTMDFEWEFTAKPVRSFT